MTTVALLSHRLATGAPSGVGRYGRELVRSLPPASPAGWDYVAASPREGAPPGWLPPGVRATHLGWNRKLLHVALTLGFAPPVDRWLDHPDLVHLLQAWVRLPTRAPQIVTVHDLLPVAHPEWFSRSQRWSYSRALDHAAEHAARLVCNSHHVASLVAARLGPGVAITAIHPGIPDAFRAPVHAEELAACLARYGLEEGRYLLALGVMSAREDPTPVLAALAEVDPALLGTPALVATGPTRYGSHAVQRNVARLRLGDRVLLAGFVPDADLRPLLAGALALVHPAQDEGFGFPPLEAMAMGTPVVCSRAGSLPEVCGEAAQLVDPSDPSAWAEAITLLATAPEVRAHQVELGRQRQAMFTWERTAEATVEVYRDVLGAR